VTNVNGLGTVHTLTLKNPRMLHLLLTFHPCISRKSVTIIILVQPINDKSF
jgi:hypothetical protein